jgi:hypothetical protein
MKPNTTKTDRRFDVRETLARAYPGKDLAKAERLLRWLDYNGYAIVEKQESHVDATLAPRPEDARDLLEAG